MSDLSFNYFPGCSQSGSAEEFGESTLAACKALGIELNEIPDWSCCGASSAHMTNDLLAVSLPARNLAIAKATGGGRDIVTVCAACYSRLKVTQNRILGDEELARKVEGVIGADPRFEGGVRHLLDVIVNDFGLRTLKDRVKRPLEGLKIAPYYGCLLVRPPEVAFGSVENPVELDNLAKALGAEVVPWSFKTDCCGGSLSLSRADIVEKMVNGLYKRAQESGANCIASACPMCTGNLEMRQKPSRFTFEVPFKIPVIYFTELILLALDRPEVEQFLKGHLVNPLPLMREMNLLNA